MKPSYVFPSILSKKYYFINGCKNYFYFVQTQKVKNRKEMGATNDFTPFNVNI